MRPRPGVGVGLANGCVGVVGSSREGDSETRASEAQGS